MAGRYKKPFEKLKQQLKEELEEYLRLFILDGLQFRDDDEGRQLVDEINRAFREGQIGKRVGRAGRSSRAGAAADRHSDGQGGTAEPGRGAGVL